MLSFKQVLGVVKGSPPPEGQDKQCQQFVVGTERSGAVLVARNDWDGKVYKSFIDMYDGGKRSVRFKQNTQNAANNGPLRLQAASLSADKAILACTVRKEQTKLNTVTRQPYLAAEYECWLMGRGDLYYTFKSPEDARQQFPRVQFLDFGEGSSRSSKCLFLYTLDKEKIEIYQLQQDKNKSGVSQTGRIYNVAEQHLWSQFMPHNNTLYVLFLKGKREGAPGSSLFGADVSLKCFSFRPGGRTETILEVSLSMKFSHSVLQSPTVYQDRPWAAGHASPDHFLRLQLITQYEKRRGKPHEDKQVTAVLVHQHDSLPGDPAIRLGLYCLMTKHCISLSITPPTSLPPLLPRTPVFVGPLQRGIIMVYLPGYFLYLLDVHHRSRPSRLLAGCVSPGFTSMSIDGVGTSVGATTTPRHESSSTSSSDPGPATPTPSPESLQRFDADSGSPINFSPAGSPKRAWTSSEDYARPTAFTHIVAQQGTVLLDSMTGTFYTYELNEPTLRDWVIKTADTDFLPSLLHYNMSHLRDLSSIGFSPLDMMTGITKHRPECLTADLFKEYFVGCTHQRVKEHYKGKDISDMLELMPRTMLVGNQGKLRMSGQGCRITITRFPGGGVGGERSVVLPVAVDCREEEEEPVTPLDMEHSGSGNGSGFFTSLKDRLSLSGFNVPMTTSSFSPPQDAAERSYASATTECFAEGVQRQLCRGGATSGAQLWAAVPRSRAVPFVNRYAQETQNVLRRLLTSMMEHLNVRSRVTFTALLELAVALEELSFPKTTELNTLLAFSAYHTCTKRQFMQTVASGGMYIDADLVAEIRSLESQNPKHDESLFLFLESTLMSQAARAKAMTEHHQEACNTQLLQHHYKEVYKLIPRTSCRSDAEETQAEYLKSDGHDPVTNFWPFEILREQWCGSGCTHSQAYLEAHAPRHVVEKLKPLVTAKQRNY